MLKEAFSLDDFDEQRMLASFMTEEDVVARLRSNGFEIVEVPGSYFWDADGYYAYCDKGAEVLAVAHLDSVYEPTPPVIAGGRLFSSAVDNRFGVYVALELLNEKRIIADILLTTNEESCASTARAFKPTKEYNWIFSLDRRGDDVALYQYQENGGEWICALTHEGFMVAHGSYSDIADLNHLGVKALNLGIGYCDNVHSQDAWVDLHVAVRQLNTFKRFYDRNHRRRFVHDPEIGFRFETLMLDIDFSTEPVNESEKLCSEIEMKMARLADTKRKRKGR